MKFACKFVEVSMNIRWHSLLHSFTIVCAFVDMCLDFLSHSLTRSLISARFFDEIDFFVRCATTYIYIGINTNEGKVSWTTSVSSYHWDSHAIVKVGTTFGRYSRLLTNSTTLWRVVRSHLRDYQHDMSYWDGLWKSSQDFSVHPVTAVHRKKINIYSNLNC